VPLATPAAFDADYDVCVIGAGPAGLACAFDCHDGGLRVLVLEAGGERPAPGVPDVRAAEILHPDFHDPVDIVAASALGGSTHWWGGRSVPLDEADFRHWPLRYDDLLPWWAKAAAFLGSIGVSETPAPGALARLSHFDATRDETWGPELAMSRRWRARIRAPDGPTIVLHARVTKLERAGNRVTSAHVQFGDEERRVGAKRFVLATGGLSGLRLLLLMQRETPSLFGGADGSLGRGYMGHLTGAIADLALADPSDVKAFAGRWLANKVFARRRIRPRAETIEREAIANIAFWLDNAAMQDAAHGSAVGSARYLAARLVRALSLRGAGNGAPLGPHLGNVARAPFSAAAGLTQAAYLIAAARLTGGHPRSTSLVPASPGAWRMHYHAEQFRDPANRISLAGSVDSIGVPKLKIDFAMRDADSISVVRAHELLDQDLQAAGAGRLRWHGDRAESVARVRAAARDGYHQLGGAVMGADARTSVVDLDLRSHDIANLYVVSGSVFPSSGQANPTLTVVALARRLAAHLAAA
jgi:choline dehydrogenase-like flavoprotein